MNHLDMTMTFKVAFFQNKNTPALWIVVDYDTAENAAGGDAQYQCDYFDCGGDKPKFLTKYKLWLSDVLANNNRRKISEAPEDLREMVLELFRKLEEFRGLMN